MGAPPEVAFASVKTYGPVPEPVTDDTVQPVLVPASERSAVVMPVTGSEKETVYVPAVREVMAMAGLVTVGRTVSYATVGAVITGKACVGPTAPVTSVTVFVCRASTSVPFVGEPEPVTVTVYGPAPEPVTPVTEKPVAVPVSAKSEAASPVTGRLKVRV